mgnify:CR=1 FL=1
MYAAPEIYIMQLQLTRPFKKGLLLRGAYTLGKTMNMADQDGWVGVLYNSPEVFDRNYAPAGFDRRQLRIGIAFRGGFDQADMVEVPGHRTGRAHLALAVEEKIADRREAYNETTSNFNECRQSFPNSLTAAIIGAAMVMIYKPTETKPHAASSKPVLQIENPSSEAVR